MTNINSQSDIPHRRVERRSTISSCHCHQLPFLPFLHSLLTSYRICFYHNLANIALSKLSQFSLFKEISNNNTY